MHIDFTYMHLVGGECFSPVLKIVLDCSKTMQHIFSEKKKTRLK